MATEPGSPDPREVLQQAVDAEGQAPNWTPPTLDVLAAAFPELQVHECIGQGGMAAVFRATQARLARPVALKVMRPDLAGEPQFAERFLREARALAALANPHVLTIHDFGERAGFCYLVTEYVDGANLRELMRVGQLSPAEVLRIVPQICAGLQFAHEHGIVHRDIKPENVLVDRQGNVKLADFGLAKLLGTEVSTLTGSAAVFGTPRYMAPEQWRGSGSVDHRADIYSLGVVLYELPTGRLPVGTYAPASQQPGVPKGVDDVLRRSLQQEPERRYQSVRDVQRDLERQEALPAARKATREADSAPVGEGPRAPSRSAGGWLAAAVAALVLGALAIVGFAVGQAARTNAALVQYERVRSYEHACLEMQSRLSAGLSWTAPLPTWDSGSAPVVMPDGSGSGVMLLVMAIAYGLFLAFACVARSQAADAAVPRWQHTLAGVFVWSPAWLAVLVPLGMLAERYADASHGFVPVLVVVLGLVLLVLVARWLHQEGASRASAVSAKPGVVFWLGVALLVALAGGLLKVAPGGAVLVPSVTFPLVPVAELAGVSRATLLARCGPPNSAEASLAATVFLYSGVEADAAGALQRVATLFGVELQGGVVVRCTGTAKWLLRPLEPARTPYLGQSRDEIVRALGAPTETQPGVEGATIARFSPALAVLFSAEGIAVQIQR